MKNVLKYVIPIMSIIVTLSCGKLDVVGKDSARAFEEMLQKAEYSAGKSGDGGCNNEKCESIDGCRAETLYKIAAPDGGASFYWHSAAGTPGVESDFFMTLDAAPFITAGLDTAKLQASITFSSGLLEIRSKTTPIPLEYKCGEQRGGYAHERLFAIYRNAINYHAELDHYGISLGNGNMFEWAKNLNTNDKDIVFVLNPEPFINAGVDVTKIEGWTFAKVTVDDENGKPIKVDKLLKPFNL
jgi:hypothetical protein